MKKYLLAISFLFFPFIAHADGTQVVPLPGVRVNDEGLFVVQAGSLNFVGSNVTVTKNGRGALVTISGGSGGGGGGVALDIFFNNANETSITTFSINVPTDLGNFSTGSSTATFNLFSLTGTTRTFTAKQSFTGNVTISTMFATQILGYNTQSPSIGGANYSLMGVYTSTLTGAVGTGTQIAGVNGYGVNTGTSALGAGSGLNGGETIGVFGYAQSFSTNGQIQLMPVHGFSLGRGHEPEIGGVMGMTTLFNDEATGGTAIMTGLHSLGRMTKTDAVTAISTCIYIDVYMQGPQIGSGGIGETWGLVGLTTYYSYLSGTLNVNPGSAWTSASPKALTDFDVSGSSGAYVKNALRSGSLIVDGNVGIGTFNPLGNLHIANTNNPTLVIQDTDNGGSLILESLAGVPLVGSSSPIPVTFWTNSTEKMRIVSGGNMGVGTTNPSSILDLFNGSATIRGSGAAANIVANAGDATRQLDISTGSTRLFCVAGSSVVLGVTLYFPDGTSMNTASAGGGVTNGTGLAGGKSTTSLDMGGNAIMNSSAAQVNGSIVVGSGTAFGTLTSTAGFVGNGHFLNSIDVAAQPFIIMSSNVVAQTFISSAAGKVDAGLVASSIKLDSATVAGTVTSTTGFIGNGHSLNSLDVAAQPFIIASSNVIAQTFISSAAGKVDAGLIQSSIKLDSMTVAGTVTSSSSFRAKSYFFSDGSEQTTAASGGGGATNGTGLMGGISTTSLNMQGHSIDNSTSISVQNGFAPIIKSTMDNLSIIVQSDIANPPKFQISPTSATWNGSIISTGTKWFYPLPLTSARLSSGTVGSLGAFATSSAAYSVVFSSWITNTASWGFSLTNQYRGGTVNFKGKFYVPNAASGNVKIVGRVWSHDTGSSGWATSYGTDNSTTLAAPTSRGNIVDFTLPLTNFDGMNTAGQSGTLAVECDPSVASIAVSPVYLIDAWLEE